MSNQTVLLEAQIIQVFSSLYPDNDGFIDLSKKTLCRWGRSDMNNLAKDSGISFPIRVKSR